MSVSIAGNRILLQEIEHPQIIHAVNMVGMGMGEQHCIDTIDPVDQCLRAKIGPRIDENPRRTAAHPDARAQPAVAWIRTRTDRARTTDDRNTG